MEEEERTHICQQEIRRLRSVVRSMETDERRYEDELRKEMETESDKQPGLKRALEIWEKIQDGE
ncbi:MAG: hypothetical protein ACLU9Q_13815 [Marvinbryantia sp.]|uniref:hypothetical protein n=1 Tax=Marvinbryantia sp. TaxID=2496532 RepID=UPI00399A8D8A